MVAQLILVQPVQVRILVHQQIENFWGIFWKSGIFIVPLQKVH